MSSPGDYAGGVTADAPIVLAARPFSARAFAFLAAAAILATAAVLYLTAPKGGDFQYSDAARHALNGAFILDFVRAHPLHDPIGWAVSYYLQYPALTILFYPPLFHTVEAGLFALFGVSHGVAQLTVTVFAVIGAGAAFLLARRLVSPVSAISAAVLFLGMPIAAFWGRQVMLDVPATSIMLCAVEALLRYLDTRKEAWLHAAALILAAALYVKQPMAFIAAPFAILLWRQGLLFKPATLRAGAIAAIALVPLALITLKFGKFNAVSMAEEAHSRVPPALFYIAALPSQLGWPLLLTALIGVPLAIFRVRARMPAPMAILLASWAIVGLIFFTAIGLKSERFDLPVLFPVALAALWALERIFTQSKGAAAGAVLALVTLVYALVLFPVPTVGGYREIAREVVSKAPTDSAVLFSGKRDGAFIFDMRELARQRNDLSIIRSDKLFFEFAVAPRYGVKTLHDLTEAQIGDVLDALDVQVVLQQNDFMLDQPVMQRLQNVLNSPRFEKVRVVPLQATVFGAEDTSITIYRRTDVDRSASTLNDYQISLPIIGRTLHLGRKAQR